MTTEQMCKLTQYVDEHARDCGGDVARAMREMRDEPSVIAEVCGIREWQSVADWLDTATLCSICRSVHGPEVIHACE